MSGFMVQGHIYQFLSEASSVISYITSKFDHISCNIKIWSQNASGKPLWVINKEHSDEGQKKMLTENNRCDEEIICFHDWIQPKSKGITEIDPSGQIYFIQYFYGIIQKHKNFNCCIQIRNVEWLH